MAEIVLIASTDALAAQGRKLKQGLASPSSLEIVRASMEDAVAYAQRRLPPDCGVIIARGNTARLLRSSRLSVPIAEIPVKDSDLIRSIEKARSLYTQEDFGIAYIGMEDIIRSVRSFLDLMHRKIRFYSAKNSADIAASVLRARKDHVRVVIGGIRTQAAAKENGLDCVLLETSEDSMQDAWLRAVELQKTAAMRQKKLQERITLMSAISDGLVGVNEKGRITMFSPAAERLFGLSEQQLLGKNCSAVFGDTERALINRCLLSGIPAEAHPFLAAGTDCVCDIHPVMTNRCPAGLIISIRRRPGQNFASGFPPAGAPVSPRQSEPFPLLTGHAPAFLQALAAANAFAGLDLPVLLSGETGVGKTTLARFIHQIGPRSGELFLVRDAACFSAEDLLAAHRGTLYLRASGQFTPETLAILSEYLECRTVPAGRGQRVSPNVRLLLGMTEPSADRLPPRLYYAVGSLTVFLSPLRERSEDIPLLTRSFLAELCNKAEESALPELPSSVFSYSWPGNLAELFSFCRRFAFLPGNGSAANPAPRIGDFLERCILEEARSHSAANAIPAAAPPASKPELPADGFLIHGQPVTYRELLALERLCQGSKTALAKKLGISRSTLWRYFKIMKEAGEDVL